MMTVVTMGARCAGRGTWGAGLLLALVVPCPAASQIPAESVLPAAAIADGTVPLRAPAWDAARDSQPDSLYRAAREALNRGDYVEASRLFRQLRERYPRSDYTPDAYYWEAYALQRSSTAEDLRRAVALLDEQERRHPNAATSRDARVLATRIRGDLARRGDASAAEDVTRAAERAAAPPPPSSPGRPGAPAPPAPGAQAQRDEDIRIAALNALLQMDAERAVPLLRQVLAMRDSGSVKLRERALFMVARQGGREAEDLLLAAARSDPSSEVRAQAVFWLSRVPGDRAVAALDSILVSSTDRDVQEKALFALSRHDNERAWGALRAYVQRANAPADLKKNAIFWLGRSDRAENQAFLRGAYPHLGDYELKQQVIYALSSSENAENRRWVLEIALNEREPLELRKQALYWAGRRGDVGIADLATLYDRIRDQDIRRQLIFVLSRRDEAAAVDKLMAIARNDPDVELRKQAVFWLGRSKDPRAASFLLELINKP